MVFYFIWATSIFWYCLLIIIFRIFRTTQLLDPTVPFQQTRNFLLHFRKSRQFIGSTCTVFCWFETSEWTENSFHFSIYLGFFCRSSKKYAFSRGAEFIDCTLMQIIFQTKSEQIYKMPVIYLLIMCQWQCLMNIVIFVHKIFSLFALIPSLITWIE